MQTEIFVHNSKCECIRIRDTQVRLDENLATCHSRRPCRTKGSRKLEGEKYAPADRAAQVLEHLPIECEALSSNPTTAK
jgi:hypothetical protein